MFKVKRSIKFGAIKRHERGHVNSCGRALLTLPPPRQFDTHNIFCFAEKIFAAFAAKKGAQLNAYKFMKDGEQVKNDDTPDGIGLEDGDQLDAILNQQGGSAGGQC